MPSVKRRPYTLDAFVSDKAPNLQQQQSSFVREFSWEQREVEWCEYDLQT